MAERHPAVSPMRHAVRAPIGDSNSYTAPKSPSKHQCRKSPTAPLRATISAGYGGENSFLRLIPCSYPIDF